mmetsp:Transcript_19821/g.29253  ORF Transcript_19821/g.29253 Transcript_19821/m.29253 type:complete len:80 (+) Transcript_19821:190-429(+)
MIDFHSIQGGGHFIPSFSLNVSEIIYTYRPDSSYNLKLLLTTFKIGYKPFFFSFKKPLPPKTFSSPTYKTSTVVHYSAR